MRAEPTRPASFGRIFAFELEMPLGASGARPQAKTCPSRRSGPRRPSGSQIDRSRSGGARLGCAGSMDSAGLRKFGVHGFVDIHVGTTEDVADTVIGEMAIHSPTQSRVDVIAIDVDGMLDRDFGLFYDSVPLGGVLIIDDYGDTISKRGSDALARYRKWDRDTTLKRILELSSFHRKRLLGKHLLTYRLVERFEAIGLLSKDNLVGSMLFCRKSGHNRFQERWTRKKADAVESSFVDDLLTYHSNADSVREHTLLPLIRGVPRSGRDDRDS